MRRSNSPNKKARRMARGALTPKQRVFVDEYLVDLNATKAAIRAGYSPATAHVQGSQLLANLRVAEAVKNEMAIRAARTRTLQDAVIDELKRLVFSDIDNYDIDPITGLVTVRDTGEMADADQVEEAKDQVRKRMRAVSSVKHRVRFDEDGKRTIETEYKLWDKPSAARLLMQHLGMLVDRIGGPNGEALGGSPTVLVIREQSE